MTLQKLFCLKWCSMKDIASPDFIATICWNEKLGGRWWCLWTLKQSFFSSSVLMTGTSSFNEQERLEKSEVLQFCWEMNFFFTQRKNTKNDKVCLEITNYIPASRICLWTVTNLGDICSWQLLFMWQEEISIVHVFLPLKPIQLSNCSLLCHNLYDI